MVEFGSQGLPSSLDLESKKPSRGHPTPQTSRQALQWSSARVCIGCTEASILLWVFQGPPLNHHGEHCEVGGNIPEAFCHS